MRMISSVTGKTYCPEDTCVILNTKQVAAYIENGYYPVDVYTGKDRMLCFAFLKTEYGRELFDKWVKHEL